MSDGPREELQGVYEMLWDCTHCDTKGLLGKSQRYCPECGAPQDPATRRFPSDAEAKEVAGAQYEGADRRCPSCDSPQSNKGSNCAHCGAPMSGARAVPLVGQAAPPPAPAARKGSGWIVLGVVAVLATLIYVRCIRTKDAQLTVAGHHWQRTIAVEELRTVTEQTWRESVPTTARLGACVRKPQSSKQVPDGETCEQVKKDRGDGTFEKVKQCAPKYRSEPVDGDWCTYAAERWTEVDAVTAKGDGAAPGPSWPTPPALPPVNGAPGPGARRLGAKTEKYSLDFKGGSRTQTCEVGEAVWRKYADGASAKIEVRASSGDVVCADL